jgi:7-carboxy-7-deazaguanine synthase
MAKKYQIKEIFYTLQGEGFHAGRAAVFCRFSGCNLWSGREQDRAEAKCNFCDTDFVGTDGTNGGTYNSANELALAIDSAWQNTSSLNDNKFVVFTGGEPLLQLDEELLLAVKKLGFYTAVESNGTITAPSEIDWLTISPKSNSELVQKSGSELKLVFPQQIKPENVSNLDFKHFYLSPMDENGDRERNNENQKAALNYCLQHPQWKLTMQHHKLWQIR